jgi:hypothetical protein
MAVRTVGGIDSSKWTVGQPCFLKQSASDISFPPHVLVYTAWSTQPRTLGMIFAVDISSILSPATECVEVKCTHRMLTEGVANSRSP